MTAAPRRGAEERREERTKAGHAERHEASPDEERDDERGTDDEQEPDPHEPQLGDMPALVRRQRGRDGGIGRQRHSNILTRTRTSGRCRGSRRNGAFGHSPRGPATTGLSSRKPTWTCGATTPRRPHTRATAPSDRTSRLCYALAPHPQPMEHRVRPATPHPRREDLGRPCRRAGRRLTRRPRDRPPPRPRGHQPPGLHRPARARPPRAPAGSHGGDRGPLHAHHATRAPDRGPDGRRPDRAAHRQLHASSASRSTPWARTRRGSSTSSGRSWA